jgi:hypothetical protein
MNLVSRTRAWWGQRRAIMRASRRKRAAQANPAELREFVYLDEVSVLSLISSRLGPVVSELTDTLSNSFKSEISGTVGANTPVIKSGIASKLEASQSSGLQVLRKANIQTTFKELVTYESDNLVIANDHLATRSPIITGGLADLDRLISSGVHPRLIVDTDDLDRGRLIEVVVELEADHTFKMSAVVSAIVALAETHPALAASLGDFDKASAVSQILGELLVGLVPIRGRVLDYQVFSRGDKRYLIHRQLCQQLPPSEQAMLEPLTVVGVTEKDSYWRDIRRVLFAASSFTVLCRISRKGLSSQWNAVKLADVLSGLLPDFAQHLTSLMAGNPFSAKAIAAVDLALLASRRLALVSYSTRLAAHLGLDPSGSIAQIQRM